MASLRLLQSALDAGKNATIADPRYFNEKSQPQKDLVQFVGFLAWYFLLVICCFIPPCIVYRRRRLWLQNDERLREAIRQMVSRELALNNLTGAEATEAMQTQRKRQITDALKETTMIVTEKDLVEKQDGKDQSPEEETREPTVEDVEIGDVLQSESTLLQLGDMQNGNRQVPAICVICLCVYEVGDSVSCSPFETCVHAFHTECAVPWLAKKMQILCPCCRQEFCQIDSEPPIRADEAALFRQFRIASNS